MPDDPDKWVDLFVGRTNFRVQGANLEDERAALAKSLGVDITELRPEPYDVEHAVPVTLRILGPELCGRLIGMAEPSRLDAAGDDLDLDAAEQQAITALSQVVAQQMLFSREEWLAQQALAARLFGRAAVDTPPLAATVSGLACGQEPSQENLDAAIETFARDVHPILLLPRLSPLSRDGRVPALFGIFDWRMTGWWGSQSWGPLVDLIEHLASEEPSLTALVPAGGEGDWVRTLVVSTGAGMTINPPDFLGSVMSFAVRLALVSGETDVDSFVEGALEGLDILRAWGTGREITVPLAIGFGGFEVPSGETIRTPYGNICGRQPETATELVGTPHAATADGGVPVLVARVLTRAEIRGPLPEGHHNLDLDPPPGAPTRADVERQVLVGVLLGAPDHLNVRPSVTWSTHLMPIAMSALSTSRWGHDSGPMVPAADLQAVESAIAAVVAHEPEGSRVASRRVVTAKSERGSAEDALIDAMIAIENLLGLGETQEMTFRVSANAAWLLEQDAESRRRRFDDVKRAYGTRSKVVHGDVVDERVIIAARDIALDTALETLRHLYLVRPDLIADRASRERLYLGCPGDDT